MAQEYKWNNNILLGNILTLNRSGGGEISRIKNIISLELKVEWTLNFFVDFFCADPNATTKQKQYLKWLKRSKRVLDSFLDSVHPMKFIFIKLQARKRNNKNSKNNKNPHQNLS